MVPQLVKHHHVQMFSCLDRVSIDDLGGWCRLQDGPARMSLLVYPPPKSRPPYYPASRMVARTVSVGIIVMD